MSPGQDWLGSDEISPRERAERIITEARRRVKLDAKNDPDFGRLTDDVSQILASRHFVLPPVMPERSVDDVQGVLAMRVYNSAKNAAPLGTPLNIPWSLAQRDGAGKFDATEITLDSVKARTGPTYDFVLYAPDGTTAIARIPTGTVNVELRGDATVLTKFGCNGKSAQAAVTVGAAAGGGTGGAGGVSGSAGATYTATEQTLINDLATALNAAVGIINTQAGQITALATLANTMRTALINNGILV